jgi:glycosyltransferase involved in cell wall biosynthesis
MTDLSLSIITPSFNQRSFIRETLDSVSGQRYSNKEHIIVDGNSDDGTINLLDEYEKDHDHMRWISEDDNGQADAINTGFEMAEGDIIGWLNSDDVYFDTGVFSRIVDYFQKFDSDIIYGDMALLSHDSNILKIHISPSFDHDKLLRYCYITQPALFFRENIFDEGLVNPSLEYAMDYDLWMRAARNYKFRHVDDVLAGDRNHIERKIISDRTLMQKESRRVARDYGRPKGMNYTKGRMKDIISSGIPRRFSSIRRTLQLYHNPPELAFDGKFIDPLGMISNIFRSNSNLV